MEDKFYVEHIDSNYRYRFIRCICNRCGAPMYETCYKLDGKDICNFCVTEVVFNAFDEELN